MASSSVYPGAHQLLMTPPRSAALEPKVLPSSISPLGRPFSKGTKRKASPETIFTSAPSGSSSKRTKLVRSSSQPALRNRKRTPRTQDSMPDLDEEGMPVRYTPTTGRISKAKKGLPVHYCQYGCGKVYTRAEHRKRHEQNHRKDALFRCTVPDCQKEFQRFDLFQRHLEKQHGQGLGYGDGTRASSVESSIASGGAADMAEHMGMQSISASMAMGVTTPPYSSTFPAYTMDQTQAQAAAWTGGQQIQPALQTSGSEPFPDAYSESLRHSNPQMAHLEPARSRTMSAPPTGAQEGFSGGAGSAVGIPQAPDTPSSAIWPQTSYWPPPQQQSITGTTGGFNEAYGAVGEYRGHRPVPGVEHVGERTANSSGSLPAIPDASDRPGLVELDAEHLQHYHNCYWESFDPLFPIVHKPSYSPASTESALLGAMMIAIGAQFSPRAHSAAHSVESYELACSMMDQIDTDADLSKLPLATLQGIFLWEYFSLYKRRNVGVHRSLNFIALYSYALELHGLGREGASSTEGPVSESTGDYGFWLKAESQKRLLLACLILDTYRSTLFHQPVTRVLPARASIPQPSGTALWKAPSESSWQTLMISSEEASPQIPFKSSLDHAVGIHVQGHLTMNEPDTLSLAAWALQLASQCPIRELLILANDSAQLFLQQVSPEEWTAAKTKLHGWIAGLNAQSDVWYAGKVLKAYFSSPATSLGRATDLPGVGLEADWCCYIAAITLWAYTSLGGMPGQVHQNLQSQTLMRGPINPSVLSSPPFVASPAAMSNNPGVQQAFLPSQPLQLPSPVLHDQSITRAHSTGTQVHASSGPDVAIRHILQTLDVPDPTGLAQLRGRQGAMPLLVAVRDVLSLDLQFKSTAMAEAIEVLNGLIESEEIRGMMVAS